MFAHVNPELAAAQAAGHQVVFTSPDDSQPVSSASWAVKAAESATAAAPIKVRVNTPYRVVHEGKVFLGGQMLTVPNDLEHHRWIQSGWVTKVGK